MSQISSGSAREDAEHRNDVVDAQEGLAVLMRLAAALRRHRLRWKSCQRIVRSKA
jgi:hypothetical protein